MDAIEIQELFIRAAEIDHKLPIAVGPARLKAQAFPYFHLDTEKAGWIPADFINGKPIPNKTIRERIAIKKNVKDQLEIDDRGRLDEESDNFWKGGKVSPADVTLWEKANTLIRLVPDEARRRCLLHWAIAKAGGFAFSTWCREEGIHQETGRRRKDRAVLSILTQLSSVSGNSTHVSAFETLLPKQGEISHISVNIGNSHSWMADGAKPLICDFDAGLKEYAWADRENHRRRQREAKRRKEAA